MAEGSGQVQSVDSTDWQPSGFPAVRVDQRDGSDELLIRIITLKPSTNVTSNLYDLLENESLDVQQYNMTSTQDKVLLSIQVKVLTPSTLDKDDLKRKLNSWAAIAAE